MKHVIIGGVAGGARLRRIDEQSEIILLEKGKHISYANCGLPYYIGGARSCWCRRLKVSVIVFGLMCV